MTEITGFINCQLSSKASCHQHTCIFLFIKYTEVTVIMPFFFCCFLFVCFFVFYQVMLPAATEETCFTPLSNINDGDQPM